MTTQLWTLEAMPKGWEVDANGTATVVGGKRDLAIVFAPAGGFSESKPANAKQMAVAIAERLECTVVVPNTNQRSAGHAAHDMIMAINRIATNGVSKIIIGGGSSGGYIAALVVQEIVKSNQELMKFISGVILLSPVIDPIERERYLQAVLADVPAIVMPINFGTLVVREQGEMIAKKGDATKILERQRAFVFDDRVSLPPPRDLPILLIAGGRDKNVPLYTLTPLMCCSSVTSVVFGWAGHSIQHIPCEAVLDEIDLFASAHAPP